MRKLKTILIFDHDRNFLLSLSGLLKKENYIVNCVDSNERCVESLKKNEASLLICGESGFNKISLDFLEKIREDSFFIKIFFLCGRECFNNRINYLYLVDDVFLKPVSFKELLLKIKNILSMERISDSGYIENTFCLNENLFFLKDKNIFRPKELKILECFLKHKDMVVSAKTISSYAWGFGDLPLKKTISVYIRRIRIKLPENFCIQTIKNRGYRMRVKNYDI